MALHRVKIGLTLHIAGEPEQRIYPAPQPGRVGVIAADFIGLKPAMQVGVGDSVKRGQVLFLDEQVPGVRHTAPAAGTVSAIHEGEQGALQSVVIELNERERDGVLSEADEVRFESYTGRNVAGLSRGEIKALLVESGLWMAFRTRPFSKAPHRDTEPHAVFVTAMDTNPLAPSPAEVIETNEADFELGLVCTAKLTEGKVYLCKARGAAIPANPNTGIYIEEFEGPHPAGTVGLHIHLLNPVDRTKTVWHVNYQDVIAIGRLFATGRLDVVRVISLAGPAVKRPRLLRTRMGTSTDDVVSNELEPGESRVISGSVFSGRTAMGDAAGYLGRYHHQVSALREGAGTSLRNVQGGPGACGERRFFRWLVPGFDSCPILGERRSALIRALARGDVERAERLGCLELDEEDVALCTFVRPAKQNYGHALRRILDLIEARETGPS